MTNSSTFQNEKSWPEFQAALLAPSFLGLDSSSSGDFSAGITFSFQQDSTVTPYLVSQLISSVSTAGPFFSQPNCVFSAVLYPIIFLSSTRTRTRLLHRNTSHRHFHLELWDEKLRVQTEREHRNMSSTAEWSVLSVWKGHVLVLKTGSWYSISTDLVFASWLELRLIVIKL